MAHLKIVSFKVNATFCLNFGEIWLPFFPSSGHADCWCFLNGPTPASLSFIFVFFKHTLQILQQIGMWKNVHPVYGAGIWTIDLWTWVSSHNCKTRGQFHKTLWICKLRICSYGQILTVNLLINWKNSVIYGEMAVNYKERSFME